MDTKYCQAMITVAEKGTISAAAKALGYTQSAVTQMLCRIEEKLEIEIFERTNKGVILTRDGARMMPLFRELARCDSRIEQEAALLNGLEIGEVRIASYSSFAIEWVAKVMAEFSRKHPGISIDVQEIYNYYEAEEMLKNEECDIAFCRYRENYGLYGEPLVDDRYTITMSTDDPFAANSCITMDQLRQRKVLGSKNGLTDMDEQDYPEMKKLEDEAMYSTSMDEMLYSMVREGIGVMFSTELMAPASRSEGIVSLPIYPDHYRTLGYYVKDPARLSSAAAAFIEATKRIVNA